MLQLRIKNKIIALNDNTKLSFIRRNDILTSEQYEKAYSLPFKLKWTPELLSFFKHIRRIDSKSNFQNIPAEILFDNQLIAKGTVTTLSDDVKSTNDTIQFFFKGKKGDRLESLDGVKLASLCDTILIEQSIKPGFKYKLSIAPQAGYPYYLSINDQGFQYNAIASDTKLTVASAMVNLINAAFPGKSEVINVYSNSEIGVLIRANENFRPRVYFSGPNTEGFELIYHKSYTESVSENFQKFIRNTLVLPHEAITFPRYRNEVFYAGKNNFFNGWFNYNFEDVNEPDGWNVKQNDVRDDENFQYSHIPFFRLSYIFKIIAEKLNLDEITVFENDLTWFEALKKAVIDNNTSLDNMNKDFFERTERTFNCFVTQIDPSKHLPDVTAKEFLNFLLTGLNLSFIIKENKLYLIRKNQIFKQKAITLENLKPNFERGFRNNEGLILKYKNDEQEKINDANKLKPLKKGSEKKQFETPFSVCYDYNYGWVETKKEGNKPLNHLKLFFENGIKNGYCNSTNTLPELNLDDIGSEKGIYATFYKGTIDSEVEGFNLTVTTYCTLNDAKKILEGKQLKVRVVTQFGTAQGMILEAKANLEAQKVALIEIVLDLLIH